MKAEDHRILAGKIRFAIIGCGHIGLRHAEFILANPECTLAAWCDTRPAAELNLEKIATTPFFRDEDELLEQDFDVLVVATPNGLHEQHALKALKKGRHVLIEKPMALNAAACAKIIREAGRSDRQVFCVMQNRYSGPSAWLKALLEKKALGRIFLVTVNCFWNRDERYYRQGSWKGTQDLDGGVLFTQFSHFIDSILWLFGDIEDIDSRFGNFSHTDSTSFEDTGIVSFHFKEGGMGCINFTTSVRRQNLESSLTVIAEKGTVRISGQYMEKVEVCTVEGHEEPGTDTAGRNIAATDAAGRDIAGSGPAPRTDPRSNHAHIYDNIVSVLKRGARPDIDPREACKVVETIEKIYSRNKPT